jgi:hypothetical protein
MSIISIITPTTGKESLEDLIESIKIQPVSVNHIVLWDKFRDGTITPDMLLQYATNQYSVNNIVMNDNFITNSKAKGSSLRAIGLMAANTDFVTFADDDVIWEQNHLESMLSTFENKNWVFCKRKIWAKLLDNNFEYLGIDDFESVGEEAKTPYKMVDNNCMMFKRKYGVSASPLYRETQDYNDDRLFYDFMKKYAGEPGKTLLPTINQVCPSRLTEFFRAGCTK